MASVRHLGLFPFCVQSYPPTFTEFGTQAKQTLATGDNSDFPLKLSVAQATRLWWTVKHWRVTGEYYFYQALQEGFIQRTGSIEVATNDDDFSQTDFIAKIENETNSEARLVCEKTDFQGTRSFVWTIQLAVAGQDENGNPTSGTATESLFLDLGGARFQTGFAPKFVKDENQDSMLWLNMSIGFGAWSTQSASQDMTATCAFKMLNREQNITLYKANSNATETLSLQLEPLEFWGYDPNDGLGPIYDTLTGVQRRAFPTN